MLSFVPVILLSDWCRISQHSFHINDTQHSQPIHFRVVVGEGTSSCVLRCACALTLKQSTSQRGTNDIRKYAAILDFHTLNNRPLFLHRTYYGLFYINKLQKQTLGPRLSRPLFFSRDPFNNTLDSQGITSQ